MQHRIVIRQRRPWVLAAAVALGVAVLAVSAWGLVRYARGVGMGGGLSAMSELDELRAERSRMQEELRDLRRQLAEAQDRQTFATRSCEIDAEACRALRGSMAGMEREAADLREQVALYRNVVAPERTRAGVRVLELALIPGDKPGIWRYDLALVQGVGKARPAEGRFELSITGTQAGKPRELGPNELAGEKARPQTYSFKYFQEFGGEFRLPDGFAPSQLKVTLLGAGDPVAESFEWSRLVAAGGSTR